MQRIDQHSPEGKALQATIKKKLADYLGEGYNDEVHAVRKPCCIVLAA